MKKFIAAVLLVVAGFAGGSAAYGAIIVPENTFLEDYYVNTVTGEVREEIKYAEAKSGVWDERLFLIDPVNKTAQYVDDTPGG